MEWNYFSDHSEAYKKYRPEYPEQIYEWIFHMLQAGKGSKVPKRIWEVACGSGQATLQLSNYFDNILATDISEEQLAQAPRQTGVKYLCAAAEEPPIKDHSIDAIIVAQALHWFDHPRFFEACARVAKENALFVAWTNATFFCHYSPIQEILSSFLKEIKEFWPPERYHVDSGYRHIDFPFSAIESPAIEMRYDWTKEQLLGYISTWSAFKKWQKSNKKAELWSDFISHLEKTWPKEKALRLEWDFHILAGRIKSP